MGAVLDLIGGLVLAYNLLRGLTTGLIRTSFGMIALVVASYCAWQYQDQVMWIAAWVPPGVPFSFLLRPVFLWMVTFVGVNLVGVALRWAVRVTPLVIADRIGGAVFGLATGVVLLCSPLLLLANFPLLQQIPMIQEVLASSHLAAALAPLVQLLLHLAPMVDPGLSVQAPGGLGA